MKNNDQLSYQETPEKIDAFKCWIQLRRWNNEEELEVGASLITTEDAKEKENDRQHLHQIVQFVKNNM